ncbi:MAG TPA: serine hydrolase [Vicinamibacteria bacterium]|nr:serine hydrolase [Vicinamibacteria bacterium]
MPTVFTPGRRVGFLGTSAACLLLLASTAAPGVPPAAVTSTAAIDTLLKGSFSADRPGAAVIVVKDGRTLFRKAYGMADLELGVTLQPDMVFRLGSITKQFTAAAILMLAEEGKLSLQDPIEKHLVGYPTQGHVITIEHLLTHTSGIQSYTDMPGWMTSRIQGPMTVTELVDGFKKEPMQFAPGEKWAYNNSGYILLGAIVEKASGKTYEAFVRERIFQPLGMTASYYDRTEPIIPKRAPGYTREGDQPRNARYLSMTQPYAAGSLASTVDDLARWDASLYGEKLLKKTSLDRAWTPYVLKSGKPTGYGYGWGASTLRGRRAISHGGGIFGFSTYAVRLPDEHVYVAVLCNSDSPSGDPGYLAKKIAALAIGDPFPEPAAITLDPKTLERYAGVYRIDETSTRTVTLENGRLYTQRSGGERLEVRPGSETDFFYDKSLTRLRFVLDAGRRATEMLFFPEGADEPERAPRVADAPAARTAAKVDPALYDAYVGDYELAPGFVLTVSREGDRLMTQATGQEKFEIFPSSETEFFLKVVDAQITFVRGPEGKVDQLVLHQGGRDMPAKRRK